MNSEEIRQALLELNTLRYRVQRSSSPIGGLFREQATQEELDRASVALEKQLPGFMLWWLHDQNTYVLMPEA